MPIGTSEGVGRFSRKRERRGPGLVFRSSDYYLFKPRWAELIKKVYEADPLVCVRCGGAMRIIAFIDQPDMIEKILSHLGLWPNPSTPKTW